LNVQQAVDEFSPISQVDHAQTAVPVIGAVYRDRIKSDLVIPDFKRGDIYFDINKFTKMCPARVCLRVLTQLISTTG
jgi:hypothetical protein